MRVPSSTPAGIATCRLRSRCTVPAPWQTLHGLRITRPRPPQVAQVRSIRKKPCCARTLPAPLQVGQVSAERLLSSEPDPLQASQATRVATRRSTLVPANASARSISDRLAEIVAGAGTRAATTAAAHEIAEHLIENVVQPAARREIEAAREAARAAALLEGRVPVAIIGGALLVVLQDVVGLVDLLETPLGLLVAGIAVGMELHGQLAIGLLELVGPSIARHAQGGVEILLCHLSPSSAISGQSLGGRASHGRDPSPLTTDH